MFLSFDTFYCNILEIYEALRCITLFVLYMVPRHWVLLCSTRKQILHNNKYFHFLKPINRFIIIIVIFTTYTYGLLPFCFFLRTSIKNQLIFDWDRSYRVQENWLKKLKLFVMVSFSQCFPMATQAFSRKCLVCYESVKSLRRRHFYGEKIVNFCRFRKIKFSDFIYFTKFNSHETFVFTLIII